MPASPRGGSSAHHRSSIVEKPSGFAELKARAEPRASSKRYFAIQTMQLSGPGKKALCAPTVLHEFDSLRARNEWVARGSAGGERYRHAITASEAASIGRRGDVERTASPVRHYAPS